MSSVCHLYVLVCHSYVLVSRPYVTRMYSHVIRMSLVCTRMSSICHLYVLVCHPYATRMYSHVTSMHSYVIGMSLVCGFTMNYSHVSHFIDPLECHANSCKRIETKEKYKSVRMHSYAFEQSYKHQKVTDTKSRNATICTI